MEIPETRYARTPDGVHIAYQVTGEGPFDFVFLNSAWISNVEIIWEWEEMAIPLRWFAARGRLIQLDRRGTGLSDGVREEMVPTLEARVEDIAAVMDEVGLERAVLIGVEDSAAQCFLFAATHPNRTAALIAYAATARGTWTPDYPWSWTPKEWEESHRALERGWATPEFVDEMIADILPSRIGDERTRRAYGRAMRHAMSPAAAVANNRMYMETDVREILPMVQAPTLVIHDVADPVEPVEEGRYIARQIPGAKLLETAGIDHSWWSGFQAAGNDIEGFLRSLEDEAAMSDRVLATVMFTDIVGSTERAAALGDREWRSELERHYAVVRAMLGRYRGAERSTAGDGFFATFDGPARAIKCARAICEVVAADGLAVRVGIHTGEVELIGDDVAGMTLHIGARVAALAGPGEVLVSSTVKDLVVGSGLTFEQAGEHELKGVPGRWNVYRVVDPGSFRAGQP